MIVFLKSMNYEWSLNISCHFSSQNSYNIDNKIMLTADLIA